MLHQKIPNRDRDARFAKKKQRTARALNIAMYPPIYSDINVSHWRFRSEGGIGEALPKKAHRSNCV
jgi:hypothetical protein